MALAAVLVLLALFCAAAPLARADAVPVAPRRIASINMCADALLLELVPRQRIVSLSGFSTDPRLSPVARLARGIPANHARAAAVLAAHPDLVVAGRFNDPDTLALLRKLGLPLLLLGVPHSVTQTRSMIKRMAAALGVPARGAALIRRMDAGLARIAATRPAHAPRPLAAVYGVNGVSPARGTLIDDLLAQAGVNNLAARLGLHGYATLSLERLLLGRPDLLVLNASIDEPSLANEILTHPALRALEHHVRVLRMPQRLWTCAGPWMVRAVRLLADARAALDAGAKETLNKPLLDSFRSGQ